MGFLRTLTRPPWRTIVGCLVLFAAGAIAYHVWQPGERIADGRHDLGRNGLWLQHGWLGDDAWFVRNARQERKAFFRNPDNVRQLADRLRRHHISDVFPHLCPCDPSGRIAAVDDAQTEAFLEAFAGFRVLPWIGGARDVQAYPQDARWRAAFVSSAAALLERHPRLVGVHVNIEPCVSGDPHFLSLLEELRVAIPRDRLLSVAAYPPPTRWHPFPEVHWDEEYYRRVAERADQLVPMMYDTALRYDKFYQQLMASWTREALAWSSGKPVLLGLPAYDDAGSGYHNPKTENLTNALLGTHAGLAGLDALPPTYQGIALYSEWEMDDDEWRQLASEFLRR